MAWAVTRLRPDSGEGSIDPPLGGISISRIVKRALGMGHAVTAAFGENELPLVVCRLRSRQVLTFLGHTACLIACLVSSLTCSLSGHFRASCCPTPSPLCSRGSSHSPVWFQATLDTSFIHSGFEAGSPVTVHCMGY